MPKNKDSPTKTPAFENDALGFVYKNLINRDPSKRRIKPNENILSMDADFDDSESDDSDYNPTNHDIDDVEIESDADDNNDKNKTDQNEVNDDDDSSTSRGDSDLDDDDDSDSEEESGDDVADCNVKNQNEPKNTKLLKNSDNNNDKNNSSIHRPLTDEELTLSYRKMLICAVCLGDQSHYDDEIVECDSCGISVHELCYGITADDNESIHSNASSASTEPWFCDPCKADIENPICDLCPNLGGIFKVTENGRWVHMVCALYVSDVTFADPENLRGPILLEVNSGSKNCTLCEDERYGQTGVCICCDAGMCKTYFHVTCAQREGLLQDIRRFQEVDPFIAYCTQHVDKAAAKKKRRNFNAMIARHRYFMKNQKKEMLINPRTANKLEICRQNFKKHYRVGEYVLDAQNRPKNQRLLDVSTSAIRRLAFKDISGQNPVAGTSNTLFEEVHDIQKKWHIQPAFSAEFVGYYFDRNIRIKQLQQQRDKLEEENKKLKENESKLLAKYKKQVGIKEEMKSKNDAIRSKIREYLKILSLFVKQPTTSTPSNQNHVNYNEEISQIKLLKLGQKLMKFEEMKTDDELWLESINNSGMKGNNQKLIKKPKTKSEFHIKECATCKETKEQHMMALCDSCKLYYHLYCLDPPLRRMPKKTRFGGWQCSNCTENEEMNNEDFLTAANKQSESQNGTMSSTNDDSITNSDIIAPTTTKRRLRENPKMVTKYTDYDDGSNLPGILSNTQSKRKDKTSKNKKVKNRQSNNKTPAATSFSNSITKAQNDSNSTSTVNNINNNAQNNRRTSRKRKTPSPPAINRQSNKTSTSPASSSGSTTTETNTPTKTTTSDNTSSINRKRKLSNCLSEQQNTTNENKIENDTSDLNVKISKSSPTKTTKSSSTPTKLITNTDGVTNSTVSGSTPVNKRSSPNVSQLACFVCKVKVQSKQSVRCDNCGNDYHYGCLKPPMNKSPKRRGYTWCCFVCEKKDQKRSESHSVSQASNSISLLATSDSTNNKENDGIKEHQSATEKETNVKKKNEKLTSLSSTATITVIEPTTSSNDKKNVNKKEIKDKPSTGGSSSLLKKNDNSPIPLVKKSKKNKSKPEISLLQKTNKKTEKDSVKMSILKDEQIKIEIGNENTETLTSIIVTNPAKVSKAINKGSNVIITTNNIAHLVPMENTTDCSNHIIHENNNNNINNNVDQPSTAAVDINTVLNDILMLEEEVQNNKKQQQHQEQESSTSIIIANNVNSNATDKNNVDGDLNDDTIKIKMEDLENNETATITQKQVSTTPESTADTADG